MFIMIRKPASSLSNAKLAKNPESGQLYCTILHYLPTSQMKQALALIRKSDTDFRHHPRIIAEAVFSIEHSLCVTGIQT